MSRPSPETLKVGTWFVCIPLHTVDSVARDARIAAERGEGPEAILASWLRIGARLLTHRGGPAVHTEQKATAWLTKTSAELETRSPEDVALKSDEALLALVYAHFDPPSSQPPPRTLEEIGARLLGEESLGVAFVACGGSSSKAASRGVLLLIGLSTFLLTLTALLAAIYLYRYLAPGPNVHAVSSAGPGVAAAPSSAGHGRENPTSHSSGPPSRAPAPAVPTALPSNTAASDAGIVSDAEAPDAEASPKPKAKVDKPKPQNSAAKSISSAGAAIPSPKPVTSAR